MAFDRRSFAGGAAATTLTAPVNAVDLSMAIASSTGWPSGTGGDFFAVIDRGTASEEKVRIDTRSGLSLTLVPNGRGVDGTAGAAHGVGATVELCVTAVDLDEANAHLSDVGRDDHTQYLTVARHDVPGRHVFGGAYGSPSTPAAIGTAAAVGTGDNPAKEDHVHALGTGAVNVAGMFLAGVVDTAALADLGVTTGKIADLNVTNGKLANNSVGTAKIIDGAVTTAKIDDDAVTVPKIAWAAWNTYTPTIGGLTGGSNTVTGRYYHVGGLVVGVVYLALGSGGNVNASMTVSLPVANSADPGAQGFFFARATDDSTALRYTGTTAIAPGASTAELIASDGGSVWDATAPFDWANLDIARFWFAYEPAAGP